MQLKSNTLVWAGMLYLLAGCGQPHEKPFLSDLSVGAGDPLYTTYAAAMERSRFVLDEGYHFAFYEPEKAIRFDTDTGGALEISFRKGGRTVSTPTQTHSAPVITSSYPDMVRYHYYPFEGIRVDAAFLAQSSRAALWEITVRNESGRPAELQANPSILKTAGPFEQVDRSADGNTYYFTHYEEPDNWTKRHGLPHATEVRNAFSVSATSRADMSGAETSRADTAYADTANKLAFRISMTIPARSSKTFRIVRLVGEEDNRAAFDSTAAALFDESFAPYREYNEELFSNVPEMEFEDPGRELLWWSAWNMMRQVFYPPEGKSSYNYYVFSREPTWGWGHGGQVFHESITMQAYAYLDPQSAMNSQRVYRERQHENGYINYRTGSYLDEVIRHEGELTSSAPWYNWINREVYAITADTAFLRDMYRSGKRFYNFYTSRRDKDGDGLAEWGGHAVLESVRDSQVAVWDEVGWPSNFEGVDVNSMLVMEAKALEEMALELGLDKEAKKWNEDFTRRSELVNRVFWDEENGFYYNADMRDNDFTFNREHDLKRDEIIGFLPMWAGIASEQQAARLVEKLTDSTQFWRRYGVPSLSAADPYYNDKGYWNGPVWVEWDYLVMQGLLKYGYEEEARELVRRVSENMILQLEENHNLWEFYSPDEPWAGYHKTYIWAGIINRMMMDVY